MWADWRRRSKGEAHDWEGNTTAQFAYSQISYRWTYPDYQYLFQSVNSNYIFKGSKGFHGNLQIKKQLVNDQWHSFIVVRELTKF